MAVRVLLDSRLIRWRGGSSPGTISSTLGRLQCISGRMPPRPPSPTPSPGSEHASSLERSPACGNEKKNERSSVLYCLVGCTSGPRKTQHMGERSGDKTLFTRNNTKDETFRLIPRLCASVYLCMCVRVCLCVSVSVHVCECESVCV